MHGDSFKSTPKLTPIQLSCISQINFNLTDKPRDPIIPKHQCYQVFNPKMKLHYKSVKQLPAMS